MGAELLPDICLLEPLIEDRSRGMDASPDEVLYVYASLVAAGILPITLMLPVPEHRHPSKHPFYRRFKDLCERFHLPMISVDLTDQDDIKSLISSSPHTNGAGAQEYARQILPQMAALGAPKDRLQQIQGLPSPEDILVRVQRLESVRKGALPGEFSVRLRPAGAQAAKFRLVQMQKIGPWSPIVEIRRKGAETEVKTLSIWDPFCHFERDSYVFLGEFELSPGEEAEVSLHLTETDPEYSTARRERESWPQPAERRLQPLGHIFAIASGALTEI